MGLLIVAAVMVIGGIVWQVAARLNERPRKLFKVKPVPVVATTTTTVAPPVVASAITHKPDVPLPPAIVEPVDDPPQLLTLPDPVPAAHVETNRLIPDGVVTPEQTNAPAVRQMRFPDRLDCVALLGDETLIFWGNRNQYGAIRIDKCFTDGSSEYTCWYLPPQNEVAGTFVDAVQTNGKVRLSAAAGGKPVNDGVGTIISCGDTDFGWMGPCGIIVPRSFSVAIVTNRDIRSVDIPTLGWNTFPFYLNVRR
ncbi:MAG: hypothetical protein C0404_11045 [Verrucomicrobia bacterium]|nr:hypothetical protein [Verrucomicrobiota bacterium]